jgi:hypothetical protein
VTAIMPRVLGGQAFRPASFPPTTYIESLIRAYCPELQDNYEEQQFLVAFNKARTSAFDEAFAAVTRDGVSCGLQLCWWVPRDICCCCQMGTRPSPCSTAAAVCLLAYR